MDYRALNTRHHSKDKVTKKQFENYLKVQKQGNINMFGYDPDIQRGDNYKTCYEWFIEKKQTGDLLINSSGLCETHLVEDANGIIHDPMTGCEVNIYD